MGKRARTRFGQLALSFSFIVLAGPAIANCSDAIAKLKGPFGQARFSVEVADDAQERARGLMHRTSMPTSSGMLFVYERAQPVAFWMRNTLIPLDMIFLDQTGQVTHIHENAIPLDETPIEGRGDVLAVLEINGGLSKKLGLDVGNLLQHPAFDQDKAAWPCAQE